MASQQQINKYTAQSALIFVGRVIKLKAVTIPGINTENTAIVQVDLTVKTIDGFLAAGTVDSSLDIASSLKLMIKSVDAKDFRNTFANHVTLLNKLDVATTFVQKSLKK